MKSDLRAFAAVLLYTLSFTVAKYCPGWYTDANTPRCIAPDKYSDITSEQQCHQTKYCCYSISGACYATRKKYRRDGYGQPKSDDQMVTEAEAIVQSSRTDGSSRSLILGPFPPPVSQPYGGQEPYPGFSKPPQFVCQPRPKFPEQCEVTKTKTVQFVREPPLNIPYCQRIPCDPTRPELDARQTDCQDTPGCFFDRNLGDYRKRFGHSVMPSVPVCHLAIRNSVFLEEARKLKTKTGWSAYLNQCLLETFNEVIRTPKEGCHLLKTLRYFKHKPKLAGWNGITDYECVLINGCWVQGEGCFYAVDANELTIQTSPTTQEMTMSGSLYYGRPPCQNFNETTAKSSIKSYHNCLISGCRLDQQAQDLYYNYLYDFGSTMSAADHWVFWRMVESGKYGAHNLHEYDTLPEQDVTVTPFSLVISYSGNSSENSLLHELQQKGSGSLLESIKSLSGLELPPRHGAPSDPFFEHMQSIQTPCTETFTSFGGRPCGPPRRSPEAKPEHCPYRGITARGMKPLQGSTQGCCDITLCFHHKDDLLTAKSGATAYYSIWSYWTECSTTCGPGIKTRKRSCIGVDQSICKGNLTDETPCQVAPCSQWGNWGQWSLCPATCNTVVQSRTRFCEPSGSFCPGKAEEARECGTGICPIENLPVYGPWTSWAGSCSPCGTSRSRRRTCTSGVCDEAILVERVTCERQCASSSSSQWYQASQCTPRFQESGCHQLWLLYCRDANGFQTRCPGNSIEYRDCQC